VARGAALAGAQPLARQRRKRVRAWRVGRRIGVTGKTASCVEEALKVLKKARGKNSRRPGQMRDVK